MGNSQTQTKTKTKKRKARSDSESSDESESGSSSDESAAKQEQTTKPKATPPPVPKRLELPAFSLDEKEFDSDRYELWTIRLPTSIPIQDLDNCELSVTKTAAHTVPGGPVAAEAEDPSSKAVSFSTKDGKNYSLRWGHAVENEAFRVLLPQEQKEKDSDDDEEVKAETTGKQMKFLSPTSVPFKRHLNVVSYMEELSETKLAPGLTNAPKPSLADENKMRIAYENVPQQKGLKRRWMPLGTSGAAQVAQKTLAPHRSAAAMKSESSDEMPEKQKRKRSNSQASDQHKKSSSKRKRADSTSSKVKAEDAREVTDSNRTKRKRADSSSSHTKNGAHAAAMKKEGVSSKEAKSSDEDASPVKKEGGEKESKADRKARKAEKKAKKAEKKAKKEKKQKKEKKKVKDEE